MHPNKIQTTKCIKEQKGRIFRQCTYQMFSQKKFLSHTQEGYLCSIQCNFVLPALRLISTEEIDKIDDN